MMDVNKVQILVQEGEGLTVEFKEHFTPRIDEDIVAFANTKGGVILLGVRDDRTISGEKLTNDLKARINAAVFFLMKHLNRRSEIKGVNRKDIYEIPFEALREAIANAIIHRDYSMRGTSLMVEVYDDRVEITNPGVFPGAQKKDFGNVSVRRNERIADLFFRMDKVERAGTGIRRMKEAMYSAGLSAPRIKQTSFYTIIFQRPIERHEKKVGEKVGGKSEKIRRKLGEKLGENEKRILEIINKNKFITIPELSKTLDISTTAVENNLAKLKVKNILKCIGPDKGGHWEIIIILPQTSNQNK